MIADHQDRSRLLCGGCEALIRSGGEDWAARNCWSRDGFPLLEKVEALPRETLGGGDWRVRASAEPAIDLAKLAHFGVGVVWRHHAAGRIDLGPYAEPLREFLLGQSALPRTYALTLNLLGGDACPVLSPPQIIDRGRVRATYGSGCAGGIWVCSTLILGLGYNLVYGRRVADLSHDNCLICCGAILGGASATSRFLRSAEDLLSTATPGGRRLKDLLGQAG